MAAAILVLSLLATIAMDREKVAESNAASMSQDAEALIEKVAGEGEAVPQLEIPAETATEEAPAQN
jgi:preprotein translocase subunit SecG